MLQRAPRHRVPGERVHLAARASRTSAAGSSAVRSRWAAPRSDRATHEAVVAARASLQLLSVALMCEDPSCAAAARGRRVRDRPRRPAAAAGGGGERARRTLAACRASCSRRGRGRAGRGRRRRRRRSPAPASSQPLSRSCASRVRRTTPASGAAAMRHDASAARCGASRARQGGRRDARQTAAPRASRAPRLYAARERPLSSGAHACCTVSAPRAAASASCGSSARAAAEIDQHDFVERRQRQPRCEAEKRVGGSAHDDERRACGGGWWPTSMQPVVVRRRFRATPAAAMMAAR